MIGFAARQGTEVEPIWWIATTAPKVKPSPRLRSTMASQFNQHTEYRRLRLIASHRNAGQAPGRHSSVLRVPQL